VEEFIKEAEIQAKKIITKKKSLLERIAKTLIEKETIEREEFEELIGQRKAEKLNIQKRKGRTAKLKIRNI